MNDAYWVSAGDPASDPASDPGGHAGRNSGSDSGGPFSPNSFSDSGWNRGGDAVSGLADPPGTDPPGTDPPGTDPPGTDPPGTDPPTSTGPPDEEPSPRKSLGDLRAPLLAASLWLGALVAWTGVTWLMLAWATVCTMAALVGRRHAWWWAVALVGVGGMVLCGLRITAVSSGPVAELAEARAVVKLEARLTSDPMIARSRFDPVMVLRARTTSITGRGTTVRTATPVVIFASPQPDLALGQRVNLTARLAPPDSPDVAATARVVGSVRVDSAPPAALQAAEGGREAIRESTRTGPGQSRYLVPALVMGDVSALSPRVVEDFRTSGLTHLVAVSGTNLTLLLGALLAVVGRLGVRGRFRTAVALFGVVGFVVLARPEPSVLRAAVMGVVGLWSLREPRSAGRVLGVGVVVLLVVDPFLAARPGFALSVMATAGLIWAAPPLADALGGWLPRWVALAIAVPVAAQFACTPLVAALSGQVSMVAVLANLLAAPAVAPATVLGLAAGAVTLLGPLGAWCGTALGWLACLFGWWIIEVGRTASGLPMAAFDVPTTPTALVALSLVSAAALVVGQRLMRRPRWSAVVTLTLLAVLIVPRPMPGWPPSGWLIVMCDVGQGDALVLATGPGEAVVIDAGPDPEAVDGCLTRLGVTRVPALILTHFHADHVGGIEGVLTGRSVGEISVTGLAEPDTGAAQVRSAATAAGVALREPQAGELAGVGDVSWEVLAPGRFATDSPNDASVIMLVEVQGVRMLLTGDVEPIGQARLERAAGAVLAGGVDILKVPHHGSRYQDLDFLTDLGADIALVSVGEDNGYGHPDPEVLRRFGAEGTRSFRTDTDGDVAVVRRPDGLFVLTRDP